MKERKSAKTEPEILRIGDLTYQYRVSKSYIYQMAKKGEFPKPIRLVSNGNAIGWLKSECDKWLEGRIAERDQEAKDA